MITDVSMRVTPAQSADISELKKIAASEINSPLSEINDAAIVKRSIDARQKRVMVNITLRVATGESKEVSPDFEPPEYKDVHKAEKSVVIVGAGPAGLFAALHALEYGIRPIIVERGDDVDTRRKKLAEISRSGVIDADSNYSFGEGGAGAYSDGKLYTRSKKRGNVEKVLSMFHYHGASSDILIDAHPHIGSDRLPSIIRNMRNKIIEMGGEVRFRTPMEKLIIEDGVAKGIETDKGEEIRGEAVIVATGHSARDVYRMLHSSDVRIEPKSLAIGVRLEHPQSLIDRLQYHSPEGRGKYLPAAEYSFVSQVGNRGVYSFCMCPGGVIVPAATGDNQLVVNGMSSSSRGSRWANSGMVVEIHPEDFPEYKEAGALAMMELQEDLERRFFESSGRTLNAPAQRMTDFVNGELSKTLPDSSYPPGVHSARVDRLLPPIIADSLREGFKKFDKQRKGFLTPEASVIGLESRTSSPVRIPRHKDSLQHISIKNLYPAGEGAGYAGGIVSAAIDGMRIIDAINNN